MQNSESLKNHLKFIYLNILNDREREAREQSRLLANDESACDQSGEFQEGQEQAIAEIRGELTRLLQEYE